MKTNRPESFIEVDELTCEQLYQRLAGSFDPIAVPSPGSQAA